MREKNMPELRFTEFCDEYTSVSLGNIATFHKGKGISKEDIDENGKIECIRYGELYTRYGENIEHVISRTIPGDHTFSEKNDILTPASGETAIDLATASRISKKGVAIGGDVNIIRTSHDGLYLSYYLNSKKKHDFTKLGQGNSVVHIYGNHLRTLKLNLPNIDEQTKVSSFILEFDKKLVILEKKITLLKQYKKGIASKLFSNLDYSDAIKLTDLYTVKTGSRNNQDKVENGIYPFYVRSQNIEKINHFSYDEEAILIPGDGKIGEIYHYISGKFEVHQRVYKINSASKNDHLKFLYYYMESKFKNHALSFSAKATVDSLRMIVFDTFVIPTIELHDQVRVANILNSITDKIECLELNLNNLKLFN